MNRHPGLDMIPSVPVLVLNFNGWDDTFGMLDTFSTYYRNIWLIDNGSAVDRSEEARLRYPGIRIIALPENIGWAAGYNVGLSMALEEDLEFAYLLNNDAIPHRGAVEAVTARITERKSMAAIGSVILDGDGKSVWFDGEYMAPGVDLDISDVHPGIRSTRAFNGAGFIIRLSAFASVGPFFEDYFLYHEEVDWSVRALRRGWQICVDGASLVTHAREGSNISHNSTYYRIRNTFIAFRRGISVSGESKHMVGLMTDQLRQISRISGKGQLAARNGLIDGLFRKVGPRGRNRHPAILRLLVMGCQLASLPHRISSRLDSARAFSNGSARSDRGRMVQPNAMMSSVMRSLLEKQGRWKKAGASSLRP